jgi:hypothetical protein
MDPDKPSVRAPTALRPPLGGREAVLWMLAASAAVVGFWALLAVRDAHPGMVLVLDLAGA